MHFYEDTSGNKYVVGADSVPKKLGEIDLHEQAFNVSFTRNSPSQIPTTITLNGKTLSIVGLKSPISIQLPQCDGNPSISIDSTYKISINNILPANGTCRCTGAAYYKESQ